MGEHQEDTHEPEEEERRPNIRALSRYVQKNHYEDLIIGDKNIGVEHE